MILIYYVKIFNKNKNFLINFVLIKKIYYCIIKAQIEYIFVEIIFLINTHSLIILLLRLIKSI